MLFPFPLQYIPSQVEPFWLQISWKPNETGGAGQYQQVPILFCRNFNRKMLCWKKCRVHVSSKQERMKKNGRKPLFAQFLWKNSAISLSWGIQKTAPIEIYDPPNPGHISHAEAKRKKTLYAQIEVILACHRFSVIYWSPPSSTCTERTSFKCLQTLKGPFLIR